ncbi:GPI alpha-1,2-mannosyltransferase 4-like [Saccoglossus kowalevskii]|uniref:Mannosyltransferase n=1 Tax=Saccoglossus kowalevskii TaxID=10224 RepID=A0ABM0LU08_SACKO|nr:PREDICTED: GPI mannosyltransferase 4-like [Saccoglossus kowalevskii]
MNKVWLVFVCLRLTLVLLPHNAYIHPDEFFQNSEIVAGDLFDINVYRSWEWKSQQPIRTCIFPYLTSGPAFVLLKVFPQLISSYTLYVMPRLVMFLFSFIFDYIMYKLSHLLHINTKLSLNLLSSSYVMLVFYTRLFSNTLESILFFILLYVILKSTLSMRQHTHKSVSHFYSCIFHLSVIIVIGVFVRVTFLSFAVFPVLYWLYHIKLNYSLHTVLKCMISFIPTIVIVTLLCTVIDSLYYGFITFEHLFSLKGLTHLFSSSELLNHFTVTPLNFLQYNLDVSNLSEHTLHPYITHILVNTPLLFLPLLWSILVLFFQKYKKIRDNFNVFLISSIVVPLFILSLAPHQEPRFLMPLLCPFVLLFCKMETRLSHGFKVSWIVWNLLGSLMFGVVHQGGLLPSMIYLDSIQHSSQTMCHYIFFHTYMPPRHILSASQIQNSTNQITVHDLMHGEDLLLFNKLDRLVPLDDSLVYVVSPSSLHHLFCHKKGMYNFQLISQFYPHLTVEDIPDYHMPDKCNQDESDTFNFIKKYFSMNVYKISLD